jgi:dGTPase
LLTLEEMRNGIPVFAAYHLEVERHWPEAAEKLQFNEVLRHLLNRLVGDLIVNTKKQILDANVQSLEDVRRSPRRLLGFGAEVDLERRQIKEFLHRELYMSQALDPDKEDAERVITERFKFWMAKPENLPSSYREKAKQDSLPRVVCDYIAGMTDNFIFEQYQKYVA